MEWREFTENVRNVSLSLCLLSPLIVYSLALSLYFRALRVFTALQLLSLFLSSLFNLHTLSSRGWNTNVNALENSSHSRVHSIVINDLCFLSLLPLLQLMQNFLTLHDFRIFLTDHSSSDQSIVTPPFVTLYWVTTRNDEVELDGMAHQPQWHFRNCHHRIGYFGWLRVVRNWFMSTTNWKSSSSLFLF